jgi:hypothetical protein
VLLPSCLYTDSGLITGLHTDGSCVVLQCCLYPDRRYVVPCCFYTEGWLMMMFVYTQQSACGAAVLYAHSH